MNNYPVEKLVQAYNILQGQGSDAFRRFVTRVEMPTEDIERVLNKHNYNTDSEFRRKIDAKIRRVKEKWADITR